MTTHTFDVFFRGLLDIEQFNQLDVSMNGLQVDNDGSEIGKIAFAVDACMEVFKRAVDASAGMLFVHHGLFWGKPLQLIGNYRRRIQFLLDHNVALYAVHLPLDQHPVWGNNAGLVGLLGIEEPEPFGLYHGCKIGYKGRLAVPLTVEEAAKRIEFAGRPPLCVYPFGKRESKTCAVVSGGAAEGALQAIEEDIDLYITGENSHSVYHEALEGGLNMIAGGHYSTEVWGVRRIMEQCASEIQMDVEFIDVPTGL
jgi:dinuclear metal center YbgI/SA1388 family protein